MSLFARSFYFGIQIDNIEDLNVNNIAAHERFALAYDLPSLKDQARNKTNPFTLTEGSKVTMVNDALVSEKIKESKAKIPLVIHLLQVTVKSEAVVWSSREYDLKEFVEGHKLRQKRVTLGPTSEWKAHPNARLFVTIFTAPKRDEIRVYPKDHRTSRVEEQAPGAVIETPAPDEVSDKTLDSREIEQLRRQVDVLRGADKVLRDRLSTVEVEKQILMKEMADLKRDTNGEQEIAKLQNTIEILRTAEKTFREKLSSSDSELISVTEKLQATLESENEAKNEVLRLQEEVATFQKLGNITKEELAISNDKRRKLEQELSEIRSSNTPRGSNTPRSRSPTQTIEDLRMREQKASERVALLEKENQVLVTELKEMKNTSENMAAYADREMSNLQKKLDEAKESEIYLSESLANAEADRYKLGQEISQYKRERAQLEEQVSNNKLAEEQYQLEKEEWQHTFETLQDWKRQHQIVTERMEYADSKHKSILEQLQNDMETLAKEKQDVERSLVLMKSNFETLEIEKKNLGTEFERESQKLREELSSKEESVLLLQADLKDRESTIKLQITKIANLEEEHAEAVKALETSVSERQSRIEQVEKELLSEQEKIKRLEDQAKETNNSLQSLVNQHQLELQEIHEKHGLDLDELKTKLQSSSTMIKDLNSQLQEVAKGGDELSKTLREQLDAANLSKDQAEAQFETQIKDLQQKVEALKNSERNLQEQVEIHSLEQSQSLEKIKELESAIATLNNEKLQEESKNNDLIGKCQQLEAQLAEVQSQNSMLESDIEVGRASQEELANKIREADLTRDELTKSLDAANNNLLRLQVTIKEVEGTVQKQAEEISDKSSKLEIAAAEIETLKSESNEQLEKIKVDHQKVISSVIAECDTKCNEVSLNHQKTVDKLVEESKEQKLQAELKEKELDQKVHSLLVQIEELTSNKDQLIVEADSLKKQLESKERDIEELRNLSGSLDEKTTFYNDKIKNLETTIGELTQEVVKLTGDCQHQLSKNQSANEQIVKMEVENQKAKSALEELQELHNSEKQKYDSLHVEHKNTLQLVSTLENEKNNQDGVLSRLREEIGQLEEKINSQTELLEKQEQRHNELLNDRDSIAKSLLELRESSDKIVQEREQALSANISLTSSMETQQKELNKTIADLQEQARSDAHTIEQLNKQFEAATSSGDELCKTLQARVSELIEQLNEKSLLLNDKTKLFEEQSRAMEMTQQELSKAIKDRDSAIENNTLEKQKLNEQLEKVESQVAEYREKIQTLETQIKNNAEQADSNYTQTISELENRLTEANKEIESLKSSTSEKIRTIQTQLSQALETIQNQQSEIAEVTCQIQSKEEELKTSRENIVVLGEELEQVRQQLLAKDSELSNTSGNFDKQTNEANEKIKQLESTISTQERDITTMKLECEQLESKMAETNMQLESIKVEKETFEKLLGSELDRVEKERDKLLLRIENSTKLESWLARERLIRDLYEQHRIVLLSRNSQYKEKIRQLSAQIEKESPKRNYTADELLREGYLSPENMLMDPINAVKCSSQRIVQYFNIWADLAGDLSELGNGETNPFLVAIVNSQFCEAMSSLFANYFAGPWFMLVTAHPWHMLEEIVEGHKKATTPDSAQMVLADKLKTGLETVSKAIDNMASSQSVKLKSGGTSRFGFPYSDFELKLRTLFIHFLNEKCLAEMISWLTSNPRHEYFLNRFYGKESVLRDKNCMKMVVESLMPLTRFPFKIDLTTTVDLSKHQPDTVSTRPLTVTSEVEPVLTNKAPSPVYEEADETVEFLMALKKLETQ